MVEVIWRGTGTRGTLHMNLCIQMTVMVHHGSWMILNKECRSWVSKDWVYHPLLHVIEKQCRLQSLGGTPDHSKELKHSCNVGSYHKDKYKPFERGSEPKIVYYVVTNMAICPLWSSTCFCFFIVGYLSWNMEFTYTLHWFMFAAATPDIQIGISQWISVRPFQRCPLQTDLFRTFIMFTVVYLESKAYSGSFREPALCEVTCTFSTAAIYP